MFADEADTEARELLADALEQIGFGAECGTWRNAFLMGATELRAGNLGTPVSVGAELVQALTVSQVFDSVAVRIDGPRAWDEHVVIAWDITDEGITYLTELRHGALHHRTVAATPDGVTTFRLTRLALIGAVTGTLDVVAALGDGTIAVTGDPGDLARLVGLVAPVDPDFDIVVP